MTRVYIDPRSQICYASLYILGLYRVFGKSRVEFNKRFFIDLIQSDGIDDFDQYFAFVILGQGDYKRYVIDFRDKTSINLNALEWSQIYGKVNYNLNTIQDSKVSQQKHKIIPIGPNFGIRIWNNFQTFYYLLLNYSHCSKTLPVNFRTYISGYNWQRKRQRYELYNDSLSSDDYIFFISSLYDKRDQNSNTNIFRAEFVRVCKNFPIKFEGGLFVKSQNPDYQDYKDVITKEYITTNNYLANVKKSAVVFNTPAVWDCHGWKLGEFLAMGKAIISTKLSNEMPFPLEHGINVHFVESTEEIREAVEKIVYDVSYRRKLEMGAKAYFMKYLAPEVEITRLIDITNQVINEK